MFEIDLHITTTLGDGTTDSTGASSQTTASQYYAGLVYGFGGGIRAGLSETLLWDQLTDATTAKGVADTNVSSGLSNPNLSLAWRFVESTISGLSADLGIVVSPSVGAKTASDGAVQTAGNNLSGNWQEQLSMSLFWSRRRNQIELLGELINNGKSTTHTSTGTSSTASYLTSNLSLTDRYQTGAHHFLQAKVEALLPSKHDAIGAAGLKTATSLPFSWSESFVIGYEPEPEIVLEISCTRHDFDSVATSSSGGNQSQTKSLTGSIELLHSF